MVVVCHVNAFSNATKLSSKLVRLFPNSVISVALVPISSLNPSNSSSKLVTSDMPTVAPYLVSSLFFIFTVRLNNTALSKSNFTNIGSNRCKLIEVSNISPFPILYSIRVNSLVYRLTFMSPSESHAKLSYFPKELKLGYQLNHTSPLPIKTDLLSCKPTTTLLPLSIKVQMLTPHFLGLVVLLNMSGAVTLTLISNTLLSSNASLRFSAYGLSSFVK